jgi:hypothetical protein
MACGGDMVKESDKDGRASCDGAVIVKFSRYGLDCSAIARRHGLTTAQFRFPFPFPLVDQNYSLAHLGIGRPPGQMDFKAFLIQKFNKTDHQWVNMSNAFTCHCNLMFCYFELSLVLNETN